MIPTKFGLTPQPPNVALLDQSTIGGFDGVSHSFVEALPCGRRPCDRGFLRVRIGTP
jgi:hypothetical protein